MGRPTLDAVYITQELHEKFSVRKRQLYHVSDKVLRKAIRWTLWMQSIQERLINLVMALHSETRFRVCVADGSYEDLESLSTLRICSKSLVVMEITNESRRGVEVQQRSAVSPLLFTVMMEITNECRRDDP